MSIAARPVASAHLIRFPSFQAAARSLVRDRRYLRRVDGLLFARLVFVGGRRTEGFTIGVVDPRRQMALCVWRDEEALDRFLERSAIARSWRALPADYCEVRTEPFAAFGSYLGEAPLRELPSAPKPDGPVVVWTFANIPLKSRPYFWRNIRRATRQLLSAPELIAGTAGPERWYGGAMTFTVWSSIDDAIRFAYRKGTHKQIVKDVNVHGLLTDSMFLRLRPYSIQGSWPKGSRFASRFEQLARSLGATQRDGVPTSVGPAVE
jgi:hypothetical protein